MYKRIRDSLFSPRQVVNYLSDRFGRIILYLLIFALLLTVPVCIKGMTHASINKTTRSQIASLFNGEDIDFKIVDGKLQGSDKTYEKKIDRFIKVRISSNLEKDSALAYSIDFEEEGINVRISNVTILSKKYIEYEELKNLDLSDLSSPNSISWDRVFNVAEKMVLEFNRASIYMIAFEQFIFNFLTLAFVSFMLTLFIVFNLQGRVKYSAMYKMAVYYATPYSIGAIISNLFGMEIFLLIGLVVSCVYTIIGSREIVNKMLDAVRK